MLDCGQVRQTAAQFKRSFFISPATLKYHDSGLNTLQTIQIAFRIERFVKIISFPSKKYNLTRVNTPTEFRPLGHVYTHRCLLNRRKESPKGHCANGANCYLQNYLTVSTPIKHGCVYTKHVNLREVGLGRLCQYGKPHSFCRIVKFNLDRIR